MIQTLQRGCGAKTLHPNGECYLVDTDMKVRNATTWTLELQVRGNELWVSNPRGGAPFDKQVVVLTNRSRGTQLDIRPLGEAELREGAAQAPLFFEGIDLRNVIAFTVG